MLPAAALGIAQLSCAAKKLNRQGLIPDVLLANHTGRVRVGRGHSNPVKRQDYGFRLKNEAAVPVRGSNGTRNLHERQSQDETEARNFYRVSRGMAITAEVESNLRSKSRRLPAVAMNTWCYYSDVVRGRCLAAGQGFSNAGSISAEWNFELGKP